MPAELTVDVRPRAGRNQVQLGPDGTVRVRVAAPPVGGAATEAVRAVLAAALGCSRSAIEIVRGASARHKLVRVAGLTAEQARRRLAGIG